MLTSSAQELCFQIIIPKYFFLIFIIQLPDLKLFIFFHFQNLKSIRCFLSNFKRLLLFLDPFTGFFIPMLTSFAQELCFQIIIQKYFFLIFVIQLPDLKLFIFFHFQNLKSFFIFRFQDPQSFPVAPCSFI